MPEIAEDVRGCSGTQQKQRTCEKARSEPISWKGVGQLSSACLFVKNLLAPGPSFQEGHPFACNCLPFKAFFPPLLFWLYTCSCNYTWPSALSYPHTDYNHTKPLFLPALYSAAHARPVGKMMWVCFVAACLCYVLEWHPPCASPQHTQSSTTAAHALYSKRMWVPHCCFRVSLCSG